MAAFAKCILLLVNTLFLLISLAFAAVGVILTFFPGKILSKVYDSVKDAVPTNAPYKIPESADDMGDVPFIRTLGIALLVFGAILFAISFLAFAGACCTSCCKWMLIVYSIVVVLIIIVEITMGTLFFVSSSPLHDEAKKNLQKMIDEDYKDDSTDTFSMSLNLIQQHFDCCGIEGVKDFGNKQHRACDTAAEQTGCYSKLQDEVEDNIVYCGLGLAILCVLQVVQVWCAIAIYKDNKIRPF